MTAKQQAEQLFDEKYLPEMCDLPDGVVKMARNMYASGRIDEALESANKTLANWKPTSATVRPYSVEIGNER